MKNGPVALERGDVLIVTDMQNCFLPGGSLPVESGYSIVDSLNRAMDIFAAAALPVILTRDWHPPDHCSFKSQGGPWPPHCVRETEDAAFSPRLRLPPSYIIISKATDPGREQYSAFFGRDAEGLTMAENLRALKAVRVFIGGVATEYCVFNTVKDMLREGYRVFVFVDGVKSIDVNPGDGERSLRELAAAGTALIGTGDIAG